MDLIDKLNTDIWQEADPEQYNQFKEYTIIAARYNKNEGFFEIAVKELTEEGDIPHIQAILNGSTVKKDPFGSVRNCELIVQEREIVGVNVHGDCAVHKTLAH